MSTPEPPDDAAAPRRASLGQVMAAVLWSFFGVRKGEAMNRDAVAIRPWQVILVGIAFAALFVLALIVIVRTIVAHAT
jgi:preprotein translocase subunit Sec61beta